MPLQSSPFHMRLAAPMAPLLASLALAACGGAENAGADAAQSACGGDGVVVSEAWARSARAGQAATAAYMTLCSDAGDALVSAAFASAGATELHVTTTSEDGTASMSPTSQIDLPAGEAVGLKPGGAHIMMIGVTEALAPGDAPTLTLEFENAGAVEVALEVRDAMSTDGHSGGH